MAADPVNVTFVAPFFLETTLRFLAAAAGLPGVRVALISQDPADRLPPGLRDRLAAHRRIADGLDAGEIAAAVRALAARLGAPHRLIGALEQLQVPLARVREHLGISGMSVAAAQNFRDKARMKTVLHEAGLPCARHALIVREQDARGFIARYGYPVVVKPPAGAGAVSTFRVESDEELDRYLRGCPPDPERPALFEEFVSGDEHSFDSVFIDGKPVWYSVSRYLPSPLTVMENPWIQWCVLLPREVESAAYADIREAAFRALEVLGMGTGLSHLEWFRRPDGSLAISEVAARPPGAQITSLLSYANDIDFYRAWPALMARNEFDPPERPYAAGAAYFRGQGRGRVRAIQGLGQAQQEIGHLVVESSLPRAGQSQASGYEGEGYVILRHPETGVVERALRRVVELVRVELG